MAATTSTSPAIRPVLAKSHWTLWSHAMVRSAGFPVDGVLALADEDLAGAADGVGAPTAPDAPDTATAAAAAAHERFAELWERHCRERLAAVADVVADPTFRLALTWQNRQLLDNAINPLMAQIARGDNRTRKLRVREQVVAAYWQRYCLKSESIGFFGPTTWATVGLPGPAVTTVPGQGLVDRATVFLEGWSIDRLAKSLEAEHDVRRWLAPRRAPQIQVEPGRVVLPNGKVEPVDALTERVLRLADGSLPAVELAERLAADDPAVAPALTYPQLQQLLSGLRGKGWVIWKFELSPSVRPEQQYRAFLESIPSAEIRDPALAVLDALESARDDAGGACLDPERLAPSLARIDELFTEATGQAATRYEGQMYAGRTLAYPECRRDLAVALGPQLVEKMAPLALLLDSVRWLMHRVREGLAVIVQDAYASLRERGTEVPNATMLMLACSSMLAGRLREVVDEALAEFHQRWDSVLKIAPGTRAASFRSEDLRAAVEEVFDAPPTSWTEARWCSPDVMISAESAEAAAEGRLTLVLGELHAAANTFDYVSMVPLHPRPEELMGCLDADHPEPRLLIALPRESRPRITTRAHPAFIRDGDHRLVTMPHIPLPLNGKAFNGADVPVVTEDGALRVVMPDGHRYDAIDLFAAVIRAEVAQVFDLYPSGYRPRITVDDMVVARERWSVSAEEMHFAQLPEEADRFVACRAWAREQGLPGRIFVKSPLETKPFYVDFAAPAFVELLVTAARRAAREGVRLSVSEMLPDLHETWLPDAQGNRYVAEFRFVAFDTDHEK